MSSLFFFNDTATTEIYTLSLHDALPIFAPRNLLDILLNINHWTDFTRHFGPLSGDDARLRNARARYLLTTFSLGTGLGVNRSEEHTSELQSQSNLVCRLLLEKKKKPKIS